MPRRFIVLESSPGDMTDAELHAFAERLGDAIAAGLTADATTSPPAGQAAEAPTEEAFDRAAGGRPDAPAPRTTP